jgi:hypothetical protein
MSTYRYHLGVYGRLVRYIGAIKTEVAIKVAVSPGVNATCIVQAVLMAQAVSIVFSRGALSGLVPYILGALGGGDVEDGGLRTNRRIQGESKLSK